VAHVTVALTTEGQPLVPSEFNLKSESGKKPGAAATMGVGSLRWSLVGCRCGPSTCIQRRAGAVAFSVGLQAYVYGYPLLNTEVSRSEMMMNPAEKDKPVLRFSQLLTRLKT